MIYLDNAATTYPKPEAVYEAMDYANRSLAFNAGRGGYKAAQEATSLIDETRQLVLDLFQAKGMADVIFCPSITHALNQVLNGIELQDGDTVYITPYEHNAVARTLYALEEKKHIKTVLLPLTEDFRIDMKKTAYLFASEHPAMVVACAMSNVTGYVLPIAELFAEAKKYDAVTVTDTAQSAGLISMCFQELNADVICFAGHKALMGPLGIGGFLLRHGMTLKKVLTGGTGSDSLNLDMPAGSRYEAASTNVIAIAGLNAAINNLDIEQHYSTLKELTGDLLEQLKVMPQVRVLGNTRDCIGIVSFVVEGYQSDEVGRILGEEYDIAVRSGFHCTPYIHDLLKDKEYNGTVRVGLGQFNSLNDVKALVDALASL